MTVVWVDGDNGDDLFEREIAVVILAFPSAPAAAVVVGVIIIIILQRTGLVSSSCVLDASDRLLMTTSQSQQHDRKERITLHPPKRVPQPWAVMDIPVVAFVDE